MDRESIADAFDRIGARDSNDALLHGVFKPDPTKSYSITIVSGPNAGARYGVDSFQYDADGNCIGATMAQPFAPPPDDQ